MYLDKQRSKITNTDSKTSQDHGVRLNLRDDDDDDDVDDGLWLGGVTVRASDLRSGGHGFGSRSGRYQATYINSTFHPSGVGKSSTGLSGWG